MSIIKSAYAHCDVPCGIYETDTATHAAATCLKMTQKYKELHDDAERENQMVRIVMYKEEHAARCKEQLYMLWSDYFKPQHLETFPDLHDKFWLATKQCGAVKQSLAEDTAQKLVNMVAEIADMFAQTKK